MHVNQLNKFMKLYYFYTLKALWDGQGKTEMYYGMPGVKKQLSGKMSIVYIFLNKKTSTENWLCLTETIQKKMSHQLRILILLQSWS